jgi:Protein of unknown function (DUF1488)
MQGLERFDHPVLDLSPKERSRVSDLINDPQTANDPVARDRNVNDALASFLNHQLWETAHPGKMWDEKGSTFPNWFFGPWSVMLEFSNQSRFFDTTRIAVRFWGYDRAMEWSFFVTAIALKKLRPGTEEDEDGLLRAFDTNRQKIHAAATKACGRERKGSYELGCADFWLRGTSDGRIDFSSLRWSKSEKVSVLERLAISVFLC